MKKTIQNLLPKSRAWKLTAGKKLDDLFSAISDTGTLARDFADDVYSDGFPQTTRVLSEWEQSLGIFGSGLTEQERRDRLEEDFKTLGGQDPSYIQSVLQGFGFDVYVHEWWVPGTEPAIGSHLPATARNPFTYLRKSSTSSSYILECGEPLAECGETLAECGESTEPIGYPLVNNIRISGVSYFLECGEPTAECGEPDAECGDFSGFFERFKDYEIPTDTDTFQYYLYIGGSTFGDAANVPQIRKEEFERLCLKICPCHLWLGMIINYI